MNNVTFTDDESQLLIELLNKEVKRAQTKLAEIEEEKRIEASLEIEPSAFDKRKRIAQRVHLENKIQICWNTLEKIESNS